MHVYLRGGDMRSRHSDSLSLVGRQAGETHAQADTQKYAHTPTQHAIRKHGEGKGRHTKQSQNAARRKEIEHNMISLVNPMYAFSQTEHANQAPEHKGPTTDVPVDWVAGGGVVRRA